MVHLSGDGGGNWTEVSKNVPGLARGTYVSRLVPSRFAASRVYATFDGHRLDDFRAYVYASEDLGRSWVSLSSSLPSGEVARTLTEDLVNADVLYLGTERGLFVSVDRGRAWHRVKANLPTVPIYEITLHPRENDMLLATHGRSIWILDDLSPFQEHAKAPSAAAHLFPVPTAVQRNAAGDRMRGFEGDRHFFGENPALGAVLTYRLPSDAKEVAIQVKDPAGKQVRELRGDELKDKNAAGIHHVAWDLRLSPLPKVKGQDDGGRFGPGDRGPFVLPGSYRATLLVDGAEVSSAALEVRGDPDIAISDGDRALYLETAGKVYELNRKAIEAANTLAELDEQLQAAKKAVEKRELPEAASAAMKDAEERVKDLRRRLGVGRREPGPPPEDDVRGEITRLRGNLLGATAVPTEAQNRTFTKLEGDLAKTVTDLNEAIGKASEVLRALGEGGFYPALPKPVSR
jgi:hypothetical protein